MVCTPTTRLGTEIDQVLYTYNTETCVVGNRPCGKFGQLQHGKVLIVNNPIAACTSTVQPRNLSCTLPTSYTVS